MSNYRIMDGTLCVSRNIKTNTIAVSKAERYLLEVAELGLSVIIQNCETKETQTLTLIIERS